MYLPLFSAEVGMMSLKKDQLVHYAMAVIKERTQRWKNRNNAAPEGQGDGAQEVEFEVEVEVEAEFEVEVEQKEDKEPKRKRGNDSQGGNERVPKKARIEGGTNEKSVDEKPPMSEDQKYALVVSDVGFLPSLLFPKPRIFRLLPTRILIFQEQDDVDLARKSVRRKSEDSGCLACR